MDRLTLGGVASIARSYAPPGIPHRAWIYGLAVDGVFEGLSGWCGTAEVEHACSRQVLLSLGGVDDLATASLGLFIVPDVTVYMGNPSSEATAHRRMRWAQEKKRNRFV